MRELFWCLVTLVGIPLAVALQEVVGEVKLSFFFESEDGRLPHGQTCDPWPYTKCDIYLTICIASQADRPCNVYYHKTDPWKDTYFSQTEIAFSLKSPIPKTLGAVIEAWDEDEDGSSNLIARFRGNLVVAEIKNAPDSIRMIRDESHFINKVRLECYGHIVCSSFLYGGDCSRKCIPDLERYSCDVNGDKRCRTGFLGAECDQLDYCVNHTCAGFAECKNAPFGFKCWCEDTSGPHCHLGYNPCDAKHNACSGNGACSPAGIHNTSFQCTCDPDWEGQRCDRRQSVCLITMSTKQTLCFNGGECKDSADRLGDYQCECPSGWWGKQCEKKIGLVHKMIFLVPMSVGSIIVFLAFIGFVINVYRKRRKPTIALSVSATTSTRAAIEEFGSPSLPKSKPSEPSNLTLISPYTSYGSSSTGARSGNSNIAHL